MRSRSLQRVLLGAFVLVIFLPLGAVALLSRQILGDTLGDFADREVLSLAESVAGEVGAYLRGPLMILRVLRGEMESRHVPEASSESFLEGAVRSTGFFRRILLLDPQGRVLLAGPRDEDLRGVDYSRQPFFRPEAKEPYWTSPQADPRTGEPVAALGLPWRGGVLVGLVSLSGLGRRLETPLKEGEVELILQDARGRVVFRSGSPGGSLSSSLGGHLQGEDRRLFTWDEGGRAWRCGAAEVPSLRWRVVVCRSLEALHAPIRRVERILLFCLLVGLGLGAAAAAGILRRVDRSLGRLESLSATLASGVYGATIPEEEGYREIVQVEEAFRVMSEAISQREGALKTSEERYALAVEGSHEGLWDWDLREGGGLFVSPRWKEILGWGPEDPDPDLTRWEEGIHPEDRDEVVTTLNAAMSPGGGSYDQTYRLRHRDGSYRWVRSRGMVLFDDAGRPVRMAGSLGDVTERVETERELRLAASVFESAQEGILVTDPQGTILSVNGALCAMTGYGREELLGQNPRVFKSGVHGGDFYRTMWDAILNQGAWQGEIWNRHKDGVVFPEWITISAVRDGVGRILRFVAVARDLTERKRYEERIAYEATHDALTGLPNRRHFLESLQHHLALAGRSGEALGVLFMDLDGFKGVNDTLGHDVGDRLLAAVGERMRRCVREGDEVARMGGDEFTFLLPQIRGREDLASVAEKILRSFREPFALGTGDPVKVTPSIGGAVYPLDGGDLQELLKLADLAMYRTKERGRNGFTQAGELPGGGKGMADRGGTGT